jgi:peptidoglycan-N-acetylglucosamine deacetylase
MSLSAASCPGADLVERVEPVVAPASEALNPTKPRDRFLDLLRLVSVLRVVALHTATKPPVIYLPWIQWIFPGMPEVFFVSGAVTAAALRKRGARGVVIKRLRRLLPPYYVYAAVALAVMYVTDARSAAPDASLDRGDWLSFLFPVVRPTGSVTRVVLWGHLWFLTSFLWVLTFSPLLHWLYRKVKLWSLLGHLLTFALVISAQKFGWFEVRSEYIDIAMFGWFFQLGFAYDDGTLVQADGPHLRSASSPVSGSLTNRQAGLGTLQRLDPRKHVGAGLGLLAMGWLVAERIEPIWRKPPGSLKPNELYSSSTAHFFVGAGWMFLAFAARVPISHWLSRHRARLVDVVTQRTYTLFIWGPAANAVAMAASRKIGGSEGNIVAYLLVTAVTLFGLVLLFGWIEDWASSRKPRLLPALR